MAESNYLSISMTVPIFNGDNYDFWSVKMKTFFQSQDLWEIVEDGCGTSREEKKKDAKALFVLQQGLADEIFPRIIGATSAKEAWDTLKEELHSSEKASEDVRNEIDEETTKRYADLHVAALEGDWAKAEAIYKDYPGDAVARLSYVGDTALHVAAAAGHTHFVEQLVKSNYMKEHDLEKKNEEGNTALTLAVMSGNVQLALPMIEKNKKLAIILNGKEDNSGLLPVQMAAMLGLKNMVDYLYTITREELKKEDRREELKNEDRIELLVKLIENDLYDVALLIVREHPELALLRVKGDQNEIGETALHALAKKPLTFNDHFGDSMQGIWNRCYYKLSGTIINVENKKMNPEALELVELLWEVIVNWLDYDKISELINKPRSLTHVAAKQGNINFLSILIRKHPDLIYKVDNNGYSIFHAAVKYRRANIFQLVHRTPSIKNAIAASLVGEEKNTILYLAAMLPADQNRLNVVSGAALQMQRELWWFKEVGKLMPPFYAELKIKHKENEKEKKITARELFTESHKNLMKEGEQWMKNTANSCMIVATLIATIVFAAAFTVPGGIKEDTGTPNFLEKASFIIFAIWDTISLVSSTCSILTFLSILTSRYAEEDFLWSLPLKLLLGLYTLFISIIGMMAVFCTTLFIVFIEGTKWPAILALALAPIPIIVFILQQIRLFLDVVWLMSLSNSFFKKIQKCFSTSTL